MGDEKVYGEVERGTQPFGRRCNVLFALSRVAVRQLLVVVDGVLDVDQVICYH